MTIDNTSYLDKCLNYFTDNINCTNNVTTNATMVCQTSISSLTSTYSPAETNKSSPSVSDMTRNPFGVLAVGDIKAILPCKYTETSAPTKVQVSGQLFVTTKALCFQRIGLFGLEIDRVIIPFNIVTTIEKCHEGKNCLFVKTQNNTKKSHVFEFTLNEIDKEMELIQKTWKESPTTLHKSAVNEMFRTITTLSQEYDDDNDDDNNMPKEENHDNDDETNDMEVILNLSSVENDGDDDDDSNNKLKTKWKNLLHDINEKSYKHEVVLDVHLDCNVKDFFRTFLADESKSSLASCHDNTGSFDVSDTKWEFTEDGKMERKIRYKNPVYVPMGPPHGQAEKTQTLTKFGHYGLCVVTHTWIHGVPLADCFYVEDCLLVKANPKGGISISIMFDICFVKRTMFKNIISMTAINDITNFFKEYVKVVQDKVQLSGDEENVDDDTTHEISTDLVLDDDSNESLHNGGVEATIDTATRKSNVFTSITNSVSSIIAALSPSILEVKPMIWVLVFALILNQWYLISQLHMFQEKISAFESFLENTSQNDL